MKILAIHAAAGAGHTKAAEAVANLLKASPGGPQVVFADALDYTSQFYKNSYQKTYTILVTKFPWAWGFVFWLTDLPCMQSFVRASRRIFNEINAKKLNRFLIAEQFDYIVSTHFFPHEVASSLKKQGLIKSKIICVVTDFDAHRIWLADGVDKYAVACEYTQNKLLELGVEREKIFVTGIPTDDKFSNHPDREALKDKLQIKKGVFTVLLATGSFGMGPLEEIAQALCDYQVLVVCGRNQELFERLSKKNLPGVKVFGLVNNMNELMAVADVMVTKPGGLSICEALVSKLPLILICPIPGQEMNNVLVLRSYGIGSSSTQLKDVIAELKKLSSNPEYLLSAKGRTKSLARPFATSDIIKLII
ncbi:MAG: glycosyltransferase [Candidatus Omnitrophota bacterium]